MSESTMDKAPEVNVETAEAQSSAVGEQSAVKAPKIKTRAVDAALMIGFVFRVPVGEGQTANEEQGFGVRYRFDATLGGGTAIPSDYAEISVRFPREGCTFACEEASSAVFDRFPNATGREKGLTVIRVCLADEARVTVHGFGIPFANADDPQVEGWVNESKPITGNLTLLDFIRQRNFYILVRLAPDVASKAFSMEKLPPPFKYPYGTDQRWDVDKFKDLIKVNKGHQFREAYNHDDDNHHMTVVNQSNVQDVMWLDDVAIEIAETKFPAYFVRPDLGVPTADTDRFFVIVATREGFLKEHQKAWMHLRQQGPLLLHLYDNPQNSEPDAIWECKIVDRPAIERHETAKHELVLLVRRPKRADMNPNYVERMELHRALVRGTGFYDWMVKEDAPRSTVAATPSLSVVDTNVVYRRLPSVNFLDFGDSVRAEAIVNEALPHDRDRFRGYLSNRPLGFGMIAGRYGRVLCSAPSDAAVDNFAARLDTRTRAMTEACNQVKEPSGPQHYRHRLVIRAYEPNAEVGAFNALLRDPTLGDGAAPERWGWAPQWKLHLSLAFWFLAVLGSPAVRELHPDDSQDLWDLRQQIDGTEPELERLRDVATGVTTWEQYERDGPVANKTIEFYLLRLLPYANMLCMTPAGTEHVAMYRAWKTRVARGIAVDEAGTMNRADLYCVWGNTCLPCFLSGDPQQTVPTVLGKNARDGDGNFLNRFAKSASISALAFFQATGIPVYRLKTKLP
ncbi:hypothetical protein BBK36DRAFT_1171340 [Trichoderma citrinoviride]|uniref:DNA2/NAM7 helicase-like C-terminal domain-containing protein n=1 Tax=Trichoderma citrinoviride TaxID=58853 RepID=A0A2T4B3I4_9HYPO|nr:hypothetical protein BBK36DRAFT_1171340 [Trichoderma citrinoviride]PTB63892.1 hypothetical protein BBK36DRAFT_1171340 [Trichoderma citrinoviride]